LLQALLLQLGGQVEVGFAGGKGAVAHFNQTLKSVEIQTLLVV
jgi:hypothetical protein